MLVRHSSVSSREHSDSVVLKTEGAGFVPQQSHCVVSLSKTHLSLLSTDSTQED